MQSAKYLKPRCKIMVRNTNRTDREDLMKTKLAEFTILWKYHHFAFPIFQGLNKYLCLIVWVQWNSLQLGGSTKLQQCLRDQLSCDFASICLISKQCEWEEIICAHPGTIHCLCDKLTIEFHVSLPHRISSLIDDITLEHVMNVHR